MKNSSNTVLRQHLSKYAFNAKELDEETGMYYYEARYYKPPVFTSRDPMLEKYFWMTPYAYCVNNPVKYVDPDGEEFDPTQDEKYITPMENDIKKRIVERTAMRDKHEIGSDEYNRLNDHILELNNALEEIATLRDDKDNIYILTFGDIMFNKYAGGKYSDAAGSLTYGGVKNGKTIININMKERYAMTTGCMLHEFKHAFQYYMGELGFYVNNQGEQVYSSNNQVLERAANYRGDVYTFKNTSSYQNYQLSPFYDSYPNEMFDSKAHVKRAHDIGCHYFNNNKRCEKVF